MTFKNKHKIKSIKNKVKLAQEKKYYVDKIFVEFKSKQNIEGVIPLYDNKITCEKLFTMIFFPKNK